MFCTKCGTENVNHAIFCKNCGQPLGAQAKGASGGLSYSPKGTTSIFRGNFLKLLFIIVPVVLVVIGVILYFSLRPGLSSGIVDRSKYPIMYSKDKEVYVVDSNSSTKVKISDNFTAANADGTPIYRLTNQSSNGQVLYYFENFDQDNTKGDLYVRKVGKVGQRVSSDVYPFCEISRNGRLILYIQDYNSDKSVGDLYLYDVDSMKKEKVATDVYPQGFRISPNGETIIFVQDFSYEKKVGDLYIKKLGSAKLKVVPEVALPVSISDNGDTYTYAVFTEDSSDPDLYIKESGKEKERIASKLHRILISQDCRNFVILSNYDSDKELGDLYYKEPSKDKDKIDSGVYDVIYSYNLVNESLGEEVVFFNDNNIGKSIAYLKSNNSSYDLYLKIGSVKDKIMSGIKYSYQVDISLDFKTAVYLGNYDTSKQSGDLYITRFEGGKIKDREKIDSNVYSSQLSKNGEYYCYLKDYKDLKGDLYVREAKDKSTIVSSDVYTYTLSDDGRSCAFMTDYSQEKAIGDLYYKSIGSDKKKLASDVHYYYTYDGRKIFFFKDYNKDNSTGDLYLIDNYKEPQKIDVDVRDIRLFTGYNDY